jgi:hypothetical protein
MNDEIIAEGVRVTRRDRERRSRGMEARRRYIHEIVPFFNVIAYYQIGYRVSGWLLHLFYKTSVDFEDERARARLPTTR